VASAPLASAPACAAPQEAMAPAAQAPTVNRYGHAAPRPRQPGAIRLATYNMLNFFDGVDDPTLSGEFDDLPMATPRQRCEKLAEAIIEMDADVLALQEVESLEALTWFRDTFLPKAGYRYIASKDVGYYRGIENSVLSRFPIVDTRIWKGMSLDDVSREGPGWSNVPEKDRRGMSFQRSPLMVEIDVSDSYRLTLFVLHHKAGRDYRHRREAEALRIVELIRQVEASDPGRNIIVMGDFNAAPWDKSLRVYLEAGMVDTLAHRIIPRWRNADQDEARLFKTHESDRVLDYVLLNSAAHREFVVGSAHVYGTLTPPESYDWKTDPQPDGYASDHYPVIIDLVPHDRK
jgi:endonuclease/exonuclease/phosphatase family metal-dependent hydrolase